MKLTELSGAAYVENNGSKIQIQVCMAPKPTLSLLHPVAFVSMSYPPFTLERTEAEWLAQSPWLLGGQWNLTHVWYLDSGSSHTTMSCSKMVIGPRNCMLHMIKVFSILRSWLCDVLVNVSSWKPSLTTQLHQVPKLLQYHRSLFNTYHH